MLVQCALIVETLVLSGWNVPVVIMALLVWVGLFKMIMFIDCVHDKTSAAHHTVGVYSRHVPWDANVSRFKVFSFKGLICTEKMCSGRAINQTCNVTCKTASPMTAYETVQTQLL